jgi:hypothetical protein
MAKKAKKTFSATVIKPSAIGDEGTPTGVHLDNFFSVMNMTRAQIHVCSVPRILARE